VLHQQLQQVQHVELQLLQDLAVQWQQQQRLSPLAAALLVLAAALLFHCTLHAMHCWDCLHAHLHPYQHLTPAPLPLALPNLALLLVLLLLPHQGA
jgi:hypothetical protein